MQTDIWNRKYAEFFCGIEDVLSCASDYDMKMSKTAAELYLRENESNICEALSSALRSCLLDTLQDWHKDYKNGGRKREAKAIVNKVFDCALKGIQIGAANGSKYRLEVPNDSDLYSTLYNMMGKKTYQVKRIGCRNGRQIWVQILPGTLYITIEAPICNTRNTFTGKRITRSCRRAVCKDCERF